MELKRSLECIKRSGGEAARLPMAGAGPLTEGKPSAVDDFELWLRHAPPGSEHCYATGVTWPEERKPISQPSISSPKRLRAVAKAVRDAYRAGRMELAQRRNGNGFDYICQKRRVIEPPQAPMMKRGRIDCV